MAAAAKEKDAKKVSWGTGRRKTSVASVRLIAPGTGQIVVNRRAMAKYFAKETDRKAAVLPLEITGSLQQFDLVIKVLGGGHTGQAGAVSLGIARALAAHDPTLRPALSKERLLTRDSRMVERKKYGQPGARRRFQFSKR